jgi:catechol 2,3-dioxygenase-like lactoylglutathione lyase family enzyme
VLLGIQHYALVVSDPERSRRFYGEALGMQEIPRPTKFTFEGAWFKAGGEEIHLISTHDTTQEASWKPAGPGAQVGLAMHIAFEVDDLAAARDRLAASGVEEFAGPMPRGDGVVQLYVRDPDGHLIELFERTGEDQSGAAARAPVRG